MIRKSGFKGKPLKIPFYFKMSLILINRRGGMSLEGFAHPENALETEMNTLTQRVLVNIEKDEIIVTADITPKTGIISSFIIEEIIAPAGCKDIDKETLDALIETIADTTTDLTQIMQLK